MRWDVCNNKPCVSNGWKQALIVVFALLSSTVPTHPLVMTCHWSFAIYHLARRNMWALVIWTIKWKVGFTFSSLSVVQQGHHMAKWAKIATLSFVPCPPWPWDLVYLRCSKYNIYRLDMNLVFDHQIQGQCKSAVISLPPHPLAIPLLLWPKATKPQSMTEGVAIIVMNS